MNKLFSVLKSYVDSFGLLGQSNRDGGDAMNFEGILYTMYKAHGVENDVVRNNDPVELSITETSHKLVATDGRGRRHSDMEKWYGDWLRLSRDQYKVFLVALAVNGATDIILKMMKHHFLGTFKYKGFTIPRMGLFMHNTKKNFVYETKEEHEEKSTPDVPHDYSDKWPDFTGPMFWALYVRVFLGPISIVASVLAVISVFTQMEAFMYLALTPYVAILLGDLQLVIDSLLNIHDDDDDVNHIIALSQVKLLNIESPIAKYARDIYFEKADYEKALDHHFRPESNNPPFNEIIKDAIKRELI